MTLKLGEGIISQISRAKVHAYSGSFTKKDLNSMIYGLRRTRKYDMNENDKFGKPLTIGDEIIVCYSRMGKLSKATIIGEKDKVWKIRVEWAYGTDDRTIDKNPERIVKYNG
jgi:hypothetical protein